MTMPRSPLPSPSQPDDEPADVLDWRQEAAFEVARLATMSDAELLALLHEQAAGYPSEVLEMLRRFEVQASGPLR